MRRAPDSAPYKDQEDTPSAQPGVGSHWPGEVGAISQNEEGRVETLGPDHTLL